MSALWVLAKLRVLDIARNRASLALLFGLPLVLLAIVTLVFMGGHPFERRHVIAVGGDPAALAALPDVTVDHEASERAALGRLDSRMASAVVFPGNPTRIVVGPRDVVFARGIAASLATPHAIETRAVPRFGYVHYLLPGLLTFSVLIAGLFGIGTAMLRFRETLFLKKLATTPLRRTTFVAAQIVARSALVLGQTLLLLLVATVALSLPVSLAAFAWLTVLTLLGIVTFLGVGFAVAAAVPREAMLVDVISASTAPLVLLSEIFFPVDVLPGPLPAVAGALPSTQMVRAVRAVLLEGVVDPRALLPAIAAMVAWMLVTYAIAVLTFRWS